MVQDPFLQKKETILKSILENSPDSPDASPKGTIDRLCLPIINLINSSSSMVTTSTCSGRISVFLEGSKQKKNSNEAKSGGKGDGGKWLYVSHEKDNIDNWYENLDDDFKIKFDDENLEAQTELTSRFLLFKFEPLILHVFCKTFEIASELYNTAMNCGFRESGIGKNNNVAIRISIRLDVPIGYLDKEDEEIVIFVKKSILKLITNLSKDKFKQNEKKLYELYKNIESMINDNKESVKLETKEERRERKIKEGLDRREEVKKLKDLKKLEKLKLETEQKESL